MALFHEINMARLFPLKAIADAKLDPNALPELETLLPDGQIPPLAWNSDLFTAASKHCSDMFARLYYNSTAPNGITFQQRVAGEGYKFDVVDERLGALIFDKYVNPTTAAQLILQQVLTAELTGGTPDIALFNPLYTEVGIGFSAGIIDAGLTDPITLYIVTIDLAAPMEPRHFVSGTIFLDINQDQQYTPEEGILGLQVSLYNTSLKTSASMTSQTMGFFQFPLAPGQNHIMGEWPPGVPITQEYFWGSGKNYYVDLLIPFEQN